jgi:hypothetical protein
LHEAGKRYALPVTLCYHDLATMPLNVQTLYHIFYQSIGQIPENISISKIFLILNLAVHERMPFPGSGTFLLP